MRTHNTDEMIRLVPARTFNVEEAIAYMRDDELVEVTPKNIRIRKAILDSGMRKRQV